MCIRCNASASRKHSIVRHVLRAWRSTIFTDGAALTAFCETGFSWMASERDALHECETLRVPEDFRSLHKAIKAARLGECIKVARCAA